MVWARHQKELAGWGRLVDALVDDGSSPDFVPAAKAALAALTATHELLLGMASGVMIPIRIRPGETLDCFRFAAR